jgi:hypothetical protein
MYLLLTVKASNLGLTDIFGPFFPRKACCNQNTSYRKMKKMKAVEKPWICKFRFCSFWYIIHPKELLKFQENVQSFHEVHILGGFYSSFEIHLLFLASTGLPRVHNPRPTTV